MKNRIHIHGKINLKSELFYLVSFSIFCFAMLAVRMYHTSSFEYRFMGMNLVLAWIPYLVSKSIMRTGKQSPIVLKGLLLFTWLIFFPNAPYMITDIYHLPDFPHAPMWFDLFMLLSFSWCGLLLGFYSLRNVQMRFFSERGLKANLLFILTMFFLGGIGIYLGRYARWNSWEVFTDPRYLFNDFISIVQNRMMIFEAAGISLLCTVFLGSIYLKFFAAKK